MTIIEDRLQQLDKLTVHHGSHTAFEDGHRALELVSWLADEPFSDHPECVSPVITAFVVNWNDSLRSDEERDRLIKPLLAGMVGTRTTKKDETTRAWMATDWLVREQAPAWLRLAGLTEHAHALENLAALTGRKQAVKAQPAIAAARAAAGDAAWAAARAAAGDAAWDAAWDAARDAAGDAAWDAARDAARDAAGDAAWAAARAAARDAARAAAMAAARDAAGDAAWAAARAALEPTVQLLQQSAALLVQRTCEVGRA